MYEISCQIKGFDGVYEAGVLANGLTREEVDFLLLEVPDTWKKDNVALLVTHETTKKLDTVVIVYANDEDVTKAVICKGGIPHKGYDQIHSRRYMQIVESVFEQPFIDELYRPYFHELLRKISKKEFKDVFEFLFRATTQDDVNRSIAYVKSLWENAKERKGRYNRDHNKEKSQVELMDDYLILFHGVSAIQKVKMSHTSSSDYGSPLLMTVRSRMATSFVEDQSEIVKQQEFRDHLMDVFKKQIPMAEFMAGFWATKAFDKISVLDNREEAEESKKKFFLDV